MSKICQHREERHANESRKDSTQKKAVAENRIRSRYRSRTTRQKDEIPIPGNQSRGRVIKRNTALNPRSPQRHARKGRTGSNRTESKPSLAGMALDRPRRADKIGGREARWSEPTKTRQAILRGWRHPSPFVQSREKRKKQGISHPDCSCPFSYALDNDGAFAVQLIGISGV